VKVHTPRKIKATVSWCRDSSDELYGRQWNKVRTLIRRER
jgi:hypothetical protein